MIHISNFCKRYDNKVVLQFDELRINNGIHLIKGSNGAGKSTFMKCLAGIVGYEGSISINNINFDENPVEYRRIINYSEAEPQYPYFLTANDLINFTCKAKDVSRAEADEFIKLLNMNDFLDKSVSSFSSGMIKKTSLLLTFLGNPKWILLDEPFTTIDQDSFRTLLSIIEAKGQENINFLISTHQHLNEVPIPFNSILHIEGDKIITT